MPPLAIRRTCGSVAAVSANIDVRRPAIVRSAEYDIRSYAVSSYVNKPANDDEECISPLDQT
jgi:putative SOS response-associated peptidase YedK